MKYVYDTENLKRYEFPTHINDIVLCRSEAEHSEVFVVVLEPGKAPPLHKHDDTEQIFYILEGQGALTIQDEADAISVKPGDVVRVPPKTYHSIRAEGGPMRYLAIDSFGDGHNEDEPTWDAHARVMCRENGWDYDRVVE
jgi:quercetin dioxygenase-like cupin family protein